MYCYWHPDHPRNQRNPPEPAQQNPTEPKRIKIDLSTIPAEHRAAAWAWIQEQMPDMAAFMGSDFWRGQTKKGGRVVVSIDQDKAPEWALETEVY